MMEKMVFLPKFSPFPYIFMSVLTLLLIVFLFYVIKAIRNKAKPIYIQYILLFLIIFLIGFNLYHMAIYHTIKYEFRSDGLYLSCGPYHDLIKYEDITGYEIKNLKFNPIASFRIPGFAIKDVYYSDEGVVRMYATSAGSNVLLIRTKNRKYGITPEDFDRFIEELKKRTNKDKQ